MLEGKEEGTRWEDGGGRERGRMGKEEEGREEREASRRTSRLSVNAKLLNESFGVVAL